MKTQRLKKRWKKHREKKVEIGNKRGWRKGGWNSMQGRMDEGIRGKSFFIHSKLPLCNQGLEFIVSFGCYDLHVLVAFVECICWVV